MLPAEHATRNKPPSGPRLAIWVLIAKFQAVIDPGRHPKLPVPPRAYQVGRRWLKRDRSWNAACLALQSGYAIERPIVGDLRLNRMTGCHDVSIR